MECCVAETAKLPNVYAPPMNGRAAPNAVYIHVPFCLHRCGYCDFTLVARQDELIPSYLTALTNELAMLDRVYDVDTIFIGGGTPTHLTAAQLEQLLSLVKEHFQLADDGEFSIEANPDGLDDDRLDTLADAGVNRLSLGVQSFNDDVLRTLERQHSGHEAVAVVYRARERFANLSLDLIFGVPAQSLQQWQDTLKTAMDLPVTHLSTYGLTFEKGTDFFSRLQKGSLAATPDEIERDMYGFAIDALAESGYQHYEISNFARAERRCRHNQVYWAADEYFAFGPGAARYVNGARSTNARNVTRWIKSWLTNQPALQDHECLNSEQKAREAIYLGLRLVDGVDVSVFEKRFGVSVSNLASDNLGDHVAAGNLEVAHGRLRLTRQGRFIADTVIADFL